MSKRRGNGEGNIRKRKDGRYEVSVMVGYHPDGRRKRKYLYGKTRREVVDKLHALQQEINMGMDLDVDYTFEQAADLWLDLRKSKIEPATYQSYEYTLCKLKQMFRNVKLRKMNPIQIERAMDSLAAEGYSASYLTKCRAVLNMIFKKGVAAGWVTWDPISSVEPSKAKVKKEPKEPFSEQEIRLMLTAGEDSLIKHAILFSLSVGLRPQCLVALEPKRHIAEDLSSVLIEQAVKSDGKGGITIGPTKNGIIRRVPIPDYLKPSADYLRRHATGRFVFTSPDNPDKPIAMSTYRKYYKKALKEIGIENPGGPHRLRHTYATLLTVVAGVDPVSASTLCRHLPRMTVEVYSHPVQPALQDAVDRLSEVFSNIG